MRSQLYNTRPLTEERISKIVRQDGRLAQLGEHRPYKARVTGSSPVASTIFYLIVLKILFKNTEKSYCSFYSKIKKCVADPCRICAENVAYPCRNFALPYDFTGLWDFLVCTFFYGRIQ